MRADVPITHVILDRDGVLNQESDLPVTSAGSWKWIPGSLEALALFSRAGVRVSVATNQSVVGRGELSPEALAAIHARMISEAREAGGAIDAVLVCPHTADAACFCRKPAPGLIREAMKLAGVAERATRVIGDDARDLEAAAAAGVEGLLVLTGKGAAVTKSRVFDPDRVYPDLRAAALALTARLPAGKCES